jgi:hypothetical protein
VNGWSTLAYGQKIPIFGLDTLETRRYTLLWLGARAIKLADLDFNLSHCGRNHKKKELYRFARYILEPKGF